MNIAILGGSFDPPHNGHLLVAHEVKKALGINEVWFIPVYSHPFQKKISSVDDRLTMTSFLKNGYIKVLDVETQNPTTSFSIETLKKLKNQYPTYEFFWVIGSDQVKDFPRWKDWKDILTSFHLIIFERTESPKELKDLVNGNIPKNLQKNVLVVTSPAVKTSPISSSEIRDKVKRGESISNFVPKEVEFYIRKHKLYQSHSLK